MQKDNRVIFLSDQGQAVEQYFNLPERNTVFVLLGKGSSITDAAVRRLADAGVVVGFCGSGGTPLFSSVDVCFLNPQSEYRPTEGMQAWVAMWFNESRRLLAAKAMLRKRLQWTQEAWNSNSELAAAKIVLPSTSISRLETGIAHANTTTGLLSAEGQWAKSIYAVLARRMDLEFKREEGKGASETMEDRVNGMLDQGNYLAYGYAATVLHTLGISFSLPLLHGKTRRGALVFDVADLIKDAYVMPTAFLAGISNWSQQQFRDQLIELCQREDVLDLLFTFVAQLPSKVVENQ